MSEPNPKMVILYVVWGVFSHKYDNSVMLEEITSDSEQLLAYNIVQITLEWLYSVAQNFF